MGIISHHPDTTAPIKGAKLPYWKEMTELALSAHKHFQMPIFIGWDIALTHEGPLVVEANTTWSVDLIQMSHNQPIMDIRFSEIFNSALALSNAP